jgi:hypothetical protein
MGAAVYNPFIGGDLQPLAFAMLYGRRPTLCYHIIYIYGGFNPLVLTALL